MIRNSLRKFVLAASAMFIMVPLVGCEEKGPAQRAGEDLDKAGRNVKDTVTPAPSTPGEKIGDKVDQATGNK